MAAPTSENDLIDMMAIPTEVDLWYRILELLSHHHNHHNMATQYSL